MFPECSLHATECSLNATECSLNVQVVNTRIVGSAVPGVDQVVFPYQPVFEQLLNAHKTVRGDSGEQQPDVVRQRTYVMR
jgi:hypothetical protein